jgi:hypothetical protein
MAGVVMIDGDPIELGRQIDFHLLHQIACRLADVGKLDAFLGGDDKAELVTIIAAPIKKGWPIRYITVSRIDLAPLTVTGDTIAFKIAKMRVHGLGADKLPSARTTALWVELHYARLHRHPPGAGADAIGIVAPPVPALQTERSRCPTAPCVKPSTALSCQTIGVATGPPDGRMNLPHERLGPRPHGSRHADRARPTTVANPAGVNAKAVIIMGHTAPFGPQNRPDKGLK